MAYFKRVPWAEITAALLVGLNLVLLGLPGALFVGFAGGLFGMLGSKVPGDAYWPAAIYVSMLMPVGFLLGVMRTARVRPDAELGELILWGLAGAAIVGSVLALVLMGLVAK